MDAAESATHAAYASRRIAEIRDSKPSEAMRLESAKAARKAKSATRQRLRLMRATVSNNCKRFRAGMALWVWPEWTKGATQGKIAEYLNSEGVATYRGKAWNRYSMRNLIAALREDGYGRRKGRAARNPHVTPKRNPHRALTD